MVRALYGSVVGSVAARLLRCDHTEHKRLIGGIIGGDDSCCGLISAITGVGMVPLSSHVMSRRQLVAAGCSAPDSDVWRVSKWLLTSLTRCSRISRMCMLCTDHVPSMSRGCVKWCSLHLHAIKIAVTEKEHLL